MKVQNAVYGMAGIVIILAVLCLLTVWLGRKWPSDRFDERQKIARGNAYRFSFWVGAVCYMAVMVYLIWSVDREPVVVPYLLMYLSMGVQAIAFHMYCLVTHSALPFAERPVGPIVCYSLMGIMELLGFFARDIKEVLPLMGQGTSAWTNLFMGGFFLILAVMYLISSLIREKE